MLVQALTTPSCLGGYSWSAQAFHHTCLAEEAALYALMVTVVWSAIETEAASGLGSLCGTASAGMAKIEMVNVEMAKGYIPVKDY